MNRSRDVTWDLVLAMHWVSVSVPFLYLFYHSLRFSSIVEMNVGIMCSCFLSFPRFCQYHLPEIKSVLSFFRSSLGSFHFPRGRNRSSDEINSPAIKPSRSKRPVTRSIRATFSPRTGGRGCFMNPASVHVTDTDSLSPSDSTRSFCLQVSNIPEPTHREHYEAIAEEQHCYIQSPPASHDQNSRHSRIQSPSPTATDLRLFNSGREPRTKPSHHGGSAWWKIHRRSNTTRTGYWDVLSFFHTNTTISPGQSRIQSESGSNAV